VHDLRLGDARELSTVLEEAPYEVSELLTGLLGARAQVQEFPGIMKVQTKSSQLWIWLAG
jgi:hypothetical protein